MMLKTLQHIFFEKMMATFWLHKTFTKKTKNFL